jgi:hypothetical protein
MKKDPEEIAAAVSGFNDEVRRYEAREKYLNFWDLLGVVGVAVGSGAFIPPASWTVKLLEMVSGPRGTHPVLDSCLDSVSAVLTKAHPDAVLVSRMRKNLKDKI